MQLRCIEISGGRALEGSIAVQGSKNAVLPILTSCLLGGGVCQIDNCPQISDVGITLQLLKSVGCKVTRQENTVWIDSADADQSEIRSEEASQIRSSVLFLGALIGRFRQAILPLPGGCAIGARPIDLHREALTAMGVKFTEDGCLAAEGSKLQGGRIHFSYPSVGATENSILAAVLAPGKTEITGGAREPEIQELCAFLNLRGARIRGAGSGRILIEGVKKLHPVRYRMQADRIVTGTYLLAAAATGGKIQIENFPSRGLEAPCEVLESLGAEISRREEGCLIRCRAGVRSLPYLETAPYPGFPTDLQSPLVAVLSGADGISCIRETVFESRFQVVKELNKMGAKIRIQGDQAIVEGTNSLSGTLVNPPDLRSGAALVLAGLHASGLTRISNIEYIERGYEDICRDFQRLGGDVRLTEEK